MKQIILISTLFLFFGKGFSQAAPDSAVTSPDPSAAAASTFTIGLLYANNADYYGQQAAERMPYAATAVSWKSRPGIYLTALAYRLLKDPSGHAVSASNLGVGYSLKLSKHWTADLGYNHSFYPAYSPFLQVSNPDNARFSLGYDRGLDSKITADYAFGKTQDVFITAGTGKQINLGSIGSGDLITFTPAVELVGGTQHFYQTYLIEKKLRDSLLGAILDPILGGGQSSTVSKTTVSTRFNLISYTLKCPLAYNRAHYMIEIQYQLSVLSQQAQSAQGKANSFLSCSFYYQF